MPKPRKTKPDNDKLYALLALAITNGAPVAKEAVKWSGICLAIFFAYKAADATTYNLGGKATAADFALKLSSGIDVEDIVAFVLAACGLSYGEVQRNLRRAQIRNSSKHIAELESRFDPGRTSSGLTPEGDTNPKDLI